MKIDRDEARRIATLAHLEFDDPSLDRLAAEMTTILGYIESLAGVKTAAADTLVGAATPMREDEVLPSIDRDRVAGNAPAWSESFFVVPKVIE